MRRPGDKLRPILSTVLEGGCWSAFSAPNDLSRGFPSSSRKPQEFQGGTITPTGVLITSNFYSIPNVNTQSSNEPNESLAEILPVVDAVLASLDRRLPTHVSREDLASAGKLALVQALNRFDGPTHEARAYCFTRVRGAVFDELRRLDPLSRRTRTQVTLVQRASAQLESALGRPPSLVEVAGATGFKHEKVRQLERIVTATAVRSLNETREDGEPLHQIADVQAANPACYAEEEDLAATLHSALARIPQNQAYVLRRYHLEDATLEEIASELSVSRERVRQLRVSAEKRLKSDVLVMALWESMAASLTPEWSLLSWVMLVHCITHEQEASGLIIDNISS